MSELAVAGHGARIAVEMTPITIGTFTDIPEVMGNVQWPNFTVPESNVTTHNDNIDAYIFGVSQREPLNFGVHYIAGNAVHQELFKATQAGTAKVKRGWRLRGPGATPSNDEVIASGFVQAFGPVVHPVREGPRTAQCVVRFSGPFILNGVIYGAGS